MFADFLTENSGWIKKTLTVYFGLCLESINIAYRMLKCNAISHEYLVWAGYAIYNCSHISALKGLVLAHCRGPSSQRPLTLSGYIHERVLPWNISSKCLRVLREATITSICGYTASAQTHVRKRTHPSLNMLHQHGDMTQQHQSQNIYKGIQE